MIEPPPVTSTTPSFTVEAKLPKKVLIVDDSGTIRQQVCVALEGVGFDVIEAGDGIAALEMMKRHEVALAIVDVNMPRLDGLGMLEQMRADSRLTSVPVLMLTTEVQQSMIARARAAGARGWMVKPIQNESLIQAVRKLTAQSPPDSP